MEMIFGIMFEKTGKNREEKIWSIRLRMEVYR